MTSINPLSTRLNALSESYKTTLHLITRLSKLQFQPGSTPLDESGEGDVRVELSSDIHDSLKQQEEELELLRQEIEDLSSGDSYNYRRRETALDREKSRLSVQVARLGEDLRLAREQFRKAQLQAQRSSQAAKQRERELLLQSYQEPSRSNTPTSLNGSTELHRRRGPQKLSEEEILANASADVTSALRRTQQLMQTELQRSQFAQETLDRSTADLQALNETYSDLDSILNKSRTLVGTLVKSTKSDTWYLQTTFYLLATTICWLIFRRLLYGPLWWLAYLPARTAFRILAAVFSVIGLTRKSSSTGLKVQPSASGGIPSFSAGQQAPHIQVGRGGGPPVEQQSQDPSPDDSLSQKIGKMAEQGRKEPVVRGDGTVLEDSNVPRNPKKRMFDTEVEKKKQEEAENAKQEKEPVRRGDGTILEESDQPRNPHKRVLDTEEESRKHDEL